MALKIVRMVGTKRTGVCAALAVVGLSIGAATMLVGAPPGPPAAVAAGTVSLANPGNVDPASGWMALTAFERSTLEPLREHWTTLDATSRTRWIKVADHLKGQPEAVVARAQRRMEAWQRLTPEQRTTARAGYALASRFTAKERHARWLAYQAGVRRPLSPARSPAVSTTATLASAPSLGQAPPLTSVAMPISNERNGLPIHSSPPAATPRVAAGRDAS